MPMHAITLMPSNMTVARQVLASHHAARGMVKVFSLLTFFRRIALAISRLLNRSWLPQRSEEHRLRHPRTKLLLQEISLLSSGELHWQFPDSSTEVSCLSVLKNNVSDTRGLNFYCRRFPQGFSSGYLFE